MRSIRHQLLIWLLAIVVAGVGAAGWLIYRQALAEANELFDYQLQAIAAALPRSPSRRCSARAPTATRAS